MRRPRRTELGNRYVGLLFVLQVVGWIILVATFDHSPGPVINWVQELPSVITLMLTPFVFLVIPAVLLASVIGGILSLVGLRPESIPALLVAPGDVVFFASAYVLAALIGWAITRNRRQ